MLDNWSSGIEIIMLRAANSFDDACLSKTTLFYARSCEQLSAKY